MEYWTSVEQELEGNKPEDMGKGFWNDLAVHGNLTEDDMRKYEDFFNWRKLSDHQQMSESFIRENADRVHWDRITQRIRMSEDFIEEFQDKVVWDYVWSYQKKLPCNFIERHLKGHGRIDWNRIVMYQKLDDKFILNHVKDLQIGYIMEYQKPNKDLMEKLHAYCKANMNKNDFKEWERSYLNHKITRFQLTEKEIEKFVELRTKMGWGGGGWCTVLEHQQLKEDFIEKHYKDIIKQDNYYLWLKQHLDEKFLKKHKKDVKWNLIWNNKKIKKTDWMLNHD